MLTGKLKSRRSWPSDQETRNESSADSARASVKFEDPGHRPPAVFTRTALRAVFKLIHRPLDGIKAYRDVHEHLKRKLVVPVTMTEATAAKLADLLQGLADPRDYAQWDEWLSIRDRDAKDLFDILRRVPIRPGIKARALLILLVPYLDLLDFAWDEPSRRTSDLLVTDSFRFHQIDFSRLSQDLLDFSVGVIEAIHPLLEASPHVSTRFMDGYQHYLLELMVYLHEGPARDRAYAKYNLRTPIVGQNYAYEPFSHLMANPDIPAEIKAQADEAMRAIITAEESGKRLPISAFKRALTQYVWTITSLLEGDSGLKYDPSILASQMSFLLDLDAPGSFHTFTGEHLVKVLGNLSDAGLQARLVRGFALGTTGCRHNQSCGRLDHRSSHDVAVALMFRGLFADDAEVTAALDHIIIQGQALSGTAGVTRARKAELAARDRAALANFSS